MNRLAAQMVGIEPLYGSNGSNQVSHRDQATPEPEEPYESEIQMLSADKAALVEEQRLILRDRATLADDGADSAEIGEVQRALDLNRRNLAECSQHLQLYERTRAMLAEWQKVNNAVASAIANAMQTPTATLTALHEQLGSLESDLTEHRAKIGALALGPGKRSSLVLR